MEGLNLGLNPYLTTISKLLFTWLLHKLNLIIGNNDPYSIADALPPNYNFVPLFLSKMQEHYKQEFTDSKSVTIRLFMRRNEYGSREYITYSCTQILKVIKLADWKYIYNHAYLHTHTRIHACMHTYIHTYIHIH